MFVSVNRYNTCLVVFSVPSVAMEDSINEKLLEKLKLYSNFNSDSTETLRAVTARLHSRTVSHGEYLT